MIGRVLVSPVTVPAKVVRIIGIRRVALIGVGVAIGALVTPVTGPELRRRIGAEIEKRRSGTQETVEVRVRRRLESAPRTWHLPQPEVVAVPFDEETGWQIILAGTVNDEAGARDLEEAARGVTGVADIDNRIRVAGEEKV